MMAGSDINLICEQFRSWEVVRMRQRRTSPVLVILLYLFLLGLPASVYGQDTINEKDKVASNCFAFLNSNMDNWRSGFSVFSDAAAGGNHFIPSGYMGDIQSIALDQNWNNNQYSGRNCIKIQVKAPFNWAGVYWQSSENNWGQDPAAYNLSGATALTFYARGEKGGETVQFFAGGINGKYPDSMAKNSTGLIKLKTTWQLYTIDLRGKDLQHLVGGFGWSMAGKDNPNGDVFYLDQISYNRVIAPQAQFINSYRVIDSSDTDNCMVNTAFTYDNALALLAYLSRGSANDMNQAKYLADAFVFAQKNDPYYSDGRLRNAYSSGELADLKTGKVRLPGWLKQGTWLQDVSQVSTHTGNVAWAILALNQYYLKTGDRTYLNSAICLGNWIENNTRDTRGAGGYTGGYQGFDGKANKIGWKSTEHNLDIYAAFSGLYRATGEQIWQNRAAYAGKFVEAMWNENDGCYMTGTLEDGITINKTNIPLDIQAWSIMALPTRDKTTRLLDWAEKNCLSEHHGFRGFDFNHDRDGIWFEGTAHMALAYRIAGNTNKYEEYLGELSRAQGSALNASGQGLTAACHNGVSTGFDWQYFARLHTGATAWYILTSQGLNPFTGINLK